MLHNPFSFPVTDPHMFRPVVVFYCNKRKISQEKALDGFLSTAELQFIAGLMKLHQRLIKKTSERKNIKIISTTSTNPYLLTPQQVSGLQNLINAVRTLMRSTPIFAFLWLKYLWIRCDNMWTVVGMKVARHYLLRYPVILLKNNLLMRPIAK